MFLITRQIILQLLKRNQGGAGEGNKNKKPHLRICAKGLDWYRDKILIFR